MFKVTAPTTTHRTRTVKSERSAIATAAAIINAEYDGATRTAPTVYVTRPDGTRFAVTESGLCVETTEVAA